MKLPSAIVFDHYGHIPQPVGSDHPGFKVICNLFDQGKAWIKLSGFYQDSKSGEPTYADMIKVGQNYVGYAPERMVWGSDWHILANLLLENLLGCYPFGFVS